MKYSVGRFLLWLRDNILNGGYPSPTNSINTIEDQTIIPVQDPTSLLHFPNEVLENVAKNFDARTLAAFACASPRLWSVCRNLSVEQISSIHVNQFLEEFMSCSGSKIRILSLSDCWSDSASIQGVILKCPNLTELNVINSSLSAQHLLAALDELNKLISLSFTVTQPAENLSRRRYPTVQRIYVELPPGHRETDFILRFLEICHGVRWLYINVLGSVEEENLTSERTRDLSIERLNKYETVVLSTEQEARLPHMMDWRWGTPLYLHVFNREWLISNQNKVHDSWRHILWFQRDVTVGLRRPRVAHAEKLPHLYEEFLLDKYIGQDEFPDDFRHGQIGLRVVSGHPMLMPPMYTLWALKELDFTSCHLMYTPEAWRSLADSCPRVEALAMPGCGFFASMRNYPFKIMSSDIVSTLSKLNLKKLHVEAQRDGCYECECGGHGCDEALTGAFTQHLSGFKELEELTLLNVRIGEDFFDGLKEPCALKTFRIRAGDSEYWKDLGSFLGNCRYLRHLKLESAELPLHDIELWEALMEVDLEQLCLSSQAWHPINVKQLKPVIQQILRSLDTLHVHADLVPNLEEVFVFLEEQIETRNDERPLNLCRFADISLRSLSDPENTIVSSFPGRSLCCLKNFIGQLKPTGWDMRL